MVTAMVSDVKCVLCVDSYELRIELSVADVQHVNFE